MPREGVFAEVLQEGTIHPGDTVITCYPDENRPFQAAVITLSDKGAKGERVDESGPADEKTVRTGGIWSSRDNDPSDEPAIVKDTADAAGRWQAAWPGAYEGGRDRYFP